ncbi:hypothetical protein BpHYR1_052209 [Brachionus plicatilis]|uniref:Uncharacterized protein n=1 Tax=Brachionus plicatilis TaxID=10195 RepID=A0A3M7SGQ9_BRAPC|nr:hypothetical protein BpHYR1_052209 [Brachionus plicatilis]
MAPEKCSHTIFSRNPGITFNENFSFNSHVDFVRSRCIDLSKTKLSRLQVLQNISIKYSYNFPQDTPSDLLINFLNDLKLDSIECYFHKYTYY